MRSLPLLLSVSLLFGLIPGCGETGERSSEPVGRTLEYRSTVHFIDATDTVSTLRAAVADTPEARSAGLMDVHDLPPDRGMLFLFDDEEPRSFWMANTPIALDIIFADTDGRIVRIHPRTQPYSQRNVRSEHPAKYVIETNAGYALRHDIREGMHIFFELDEPAD